jgi:hypothetical protein
MDDYTIVFLSAMPDELFIQAGNFQRWLSYEAFNKISYFI